MENITHITPFICCYTLTKDKLTLPLELSQNRKNTFSIASELTLNTVNLFFALNEPVKPGLL